jgi:hypothetical protein
LANKTQTPGIYPKENILHLEHGENLKSRIIHLYGEETSRHIRLFEKLRIKKTKLLTSLTFLLRCRDHNTIPRFLQIHQHIHSRAANRIYQRTSFALLRERIHQRPIKHRRRGFTQKKIYFMSFLLYKTLIQANNGRPTSSFLDMILPAIDISL